MKAQCRLLPCFFLLAVALLPPDALAQPSVDPVKTARVQIGPFGLTPSIALKDLGVDSNVFNEVDNPKQDFTATLSPQASAWLRAGRSRFFTTDRLDLVYFHTYSKERSVDGDVQGGWEMPLNHLRPWLSGGFARGRQRLGYEVDLRSRRVNKEMAFGADFKVASKTQLGLSARRTTYAFDADAIFLGSNLQQVLNRSAESVTAQSRYSLTPLTTFVLQGDAIRDRFEFSPDRNADSVRVTAGFDLASSALIAGRARVGYRKFDPLGGGVSPYRGLVADVAVTSTLKGRARVEVASQRDVNYSFEVVYPYYVQTGVLMTVTPRLTDHWDVQARAGGQRLAYDGRQAGLDARVDKVVLFGAGIGYRVGRDTRVGLNVDRQRRRSPVQARDFTGYRIGSSVTYGR